MYCSKLIRIALLVLILAASAMNAAAQTKVILQEIDVKEGDTLWGIANFYLKDPKAWTEILKYNKLASTDPNVILPGMKLKVPVKLVKESLRPYSRHGKRTDWQLNQAGRVVKPSRAEVLSNPRARSAKLRVYQKKLLN